MYSTVEPRLIWSPMGQENLVILMGDRINEDFFYKKMYGRFARQPKKWLNNKVTVLPRWPFGGVSLRCSMRVLNGHAIDVTLTEN